MMRSSSRLKQKQHGGDSGGDGDGENKELTTTIIPTTPTTPTMSKSTIHNNNNNKNNNNHRAERDVSTSNGVNRNSLTPEEREAKIKSEARAYALSGSTNEGKNYQKNKRKLPQTQLQFAIAAQQQRHQLSQTMVTLTANNNAASTSTSKTKPKRKSKSKALPVSKQQQQQQQHQQQQQQRIGIEAAGGGGGRRTAVKGSTTTIATATSTAAAHLSTYTPSTSAAKRQRTMTTTTTPPPPPENGIAVKANISKGVIIEGSVSKIATTTGNQAAASSSSSSLSLSLSRRGKQPAVVVTGGPIPITTTATATATTTIGKDMFHATDNDPSNSKDSYDPDYLRMIQSLTELDDFSIWDQLSNIDDEEFRLSDLDDDDEDDDDDDDILFEGVAAVDNNSTMEGDGSSIGDVPLAAEASGTPGGTSSTTLSSTMAAAPTTPGPVDVISDDKHLSSPPLQFPGWDDTKEDGGEFYQNLEEELGNLLEEDLEAAVQSLYCHSNKSNKGENTKGEDDEGIGGGGDSTGTGKKNQKRGRKSKLGSGAEKARMAKEYELQRPLIVSTITNAGAHATTPVTAGTLAAAAQRKAKEEQVEGTTEGTHTKSSSHNETPMRDADRKQHSSKKGEVGGSGGHHSGVHITYGQSQQLQTLMHRHYQVLTQQAILSVRAAHSQKTAPAAAAAGNGTGDFFCGENEQELIEILDLAVGMLQDLDQNRKDAIRTQIQSHSCTTSTSTTGSSHSYENNTTRSPPQSQSQSQLVRTRTRTTTRNMGGNDDTTTCSTGNSVSDSVRNEDDVIMIGINGGEEEKVDARRSLMPHFNADEQEISSSSLSLSASTILSTNPAADTDAGVHAGAMTPANAKSHSHNSTVTSAVIGRTGRLTRAAFRKLQTQNIAGLLSQRTAFDIPGLLKLKETFSTIDASVNVPTHTLPNMPMTIVSNPRSTSTSTASTAITATTTTKGSTSTTQSTALLFGKPLQSAKVNILQATTHAKACHLVLVDAGATVEEQLLPGRTDLSDSFSQIAEHLGDDDTTTTDCQPAQEVYLRKNRTLFTSGEDNLVLRGVNLYGEKQWMLIADRYLPDRSINAISQRYSQLCVMLYKAHGIAIDATGKLVAPPKLESVDDIDEGQVRARNLTLVKPPDILNVHRWSIDEDVTLLKAVPIMGHMWAELGARLIPHRDRGHLRKRYQVLERRVKATVARGLKQAAKAKQTTRKAQVAAAAAVASAKIYSSSTTSRKMMTTKTMTTTTTTTTTPSRGTTGTATGTDGTKASRGKVPVPRVIGRPSKYGVGKKAVASASAPAPAKVVVPQLVPKSATNSVAITKYTQSVPSPNHHRGRQTNTQTCSFSSLPKTSPSKVVVSSTKPFVTATTTKKVTTVPVPVPRGSNSNVPTSTDTTIPLMSLESAAASLAFIKPIENEKQKQKQQFSLQATTTVAVLQNTNTRRSPSSPGAKVGMGAEPEPAMQATVKAKAKATTTTSAEVSSKKAAVTSKGETTKTKRAVLQHVSSIPTTTTPTTSEVVVAAAAAAAAAPELVPSQQLSSTSIRTVATANTNPPLQYPVMYPPPLPYPPSSTEESSSVPRSPTKMKTYAFPLRAGTRITTSNDTETEKLSHEKSSATTNPAYVYQYHHPHPPPQPHPDYPHQYYYPGYHYPPGYHEYYHQQQQQHLQQQQNDTEDNTDAPPPSETSTNNKNQQYASYPYYYHHQGYPPPPPLPYPQNPPTDSTDTENKSDTEMETTTNTNTDHDGTTVPSKTTPTPKKDATKNNYSSNNYYYSMGFSAESKRYPADATAAVSSPKPSPAPRLFTDIPGTPIDRSLLASIPTMVGEHLAAATAAMEIHGDEGDASRLAYEKLIEGGEEASGTEVNNNNTTINIDSHQLLRVKKMMENEDEAEAANAIVCHLAKSPGRRPKRRRPPPTSTEKTSKLLTSPKPVSKFSTNYDPHSNITGFSLLNEASITTPRLNYDTLSPSSSRKTKSSTESGLNLLERVLNHSSSNLKFPVRSKSNDDVNSKLVETAAIPATTSTSNTMKLSRYDSTGSSSTSITVANPETPTKNKQQRLSSTSGFFATGGGGTPHLGLSPGFRSLAGSSLLKSDTVTAGGGMGAATNLTAPFSPAPSALLKGEGVGGLFTNPGTTLGSMNLEVTNLSVPYSPAPSTVLRMFDDNKTTDENVFFNDDSRICEDSNQLGDLAVGANLNNNDVQQQHPQQHHHQYTMYNNNSNIETATSTSLLIAPNEFDAISGLGALSNSPFKAYIESNPLTNPLALVDYDDGEERHRNSTTKKNKKSTKSFFARVIGESKETSPSKKLHF